ncbi:MAG TPA: RNase J family beta-CASP ribonuclease [Ruminococcaceae bacterium]|nr:RNase J family beta-CASP ribonuclease [Oscillospiraceae bacterium]
MMWTFGVLRCLDEAFMQEKETNLLGGEKKSKPKQHRFYRNTKKNTTQNTAKAEMAAEEIKKESKKEATKKKPSAPKKKEKRVEEKQPKRTKSEANIQNTKPKKAEKGKKTGKSSKMPIRIAFLGGLNEVGKNMTLYEYNGDMFLVDCGLAFPDPDLLGVDLVLPDFTYVERNVDRIKGIIVTHGHEDHIGGLAYLLKTANIPVYSTKLTIGLIEGKLKEHHLLSSAKLNVVKPGDTVNLGAFSVELIHVNHSIPDAIALCIRCKGGTIVQTGDFKIDMTPIDGDQIDLNRLAQIGSEGVTCLLSDSTNAERPGFTPSERLVGKSFDNLFRQAGNRRIIVATFASNIHRVQQIIDTASALGRKVALSGRSLENVVSVAKELGYIHVPDGLLVSIETVNKYPADQMVIVTTGSQGEPMSALTRMAFSDHRRVAVGPTDYIIISATPIPGNEKTVGRVVDELLKLGAEVIYERMYEVHVSGHACQEELKMILNLVKPKYFIPVHGEQKHLQKHGLLAQSMGIDKKNIVIADNGIQVEMTDKSIRIAGNVPSGKVYVDGAGVGDVGSVVLRERKRLSEDGIVIVSASVDAQSGYIVSGPEIITRGFVYAKEADELILEAKNIAARAIEGKLLRSPDLVAAKTKVRDDVGRFVADKTRRSPMIVPIIMEV